MIYCKHFQNLVVLDVRNQSEYNLGHLYNAVLIPLYPLKERTGELQEHVNDPIIVYCKAGSRSQNACQTLVSYGFKNVYNMLGGIQSWIEAGYPIYTTYHYVTVDIADNGRKTQVNIEPLLLHQTGCTSCGGQNSSCQSANEPPNIVSTVLEQEENYTKILVTYEVNGTIYQVTVAHTLLWSYSELVHEANRTENFAKTEITAEDTQIQFYSLTYLVQNAEYNLTLYTNLVPLNEENYNNSYTIVNYAPAGKSELLSMEIVEFNSPVTLSQQYNVLGKVAKDIGKTYQKSGDQTSKKLAESYYTIEKETKHLSKIAKMELQAYDKEIMKCSAILADADLLDCFACIGQILTTYATLPLCVTCVSCVVSCLTIFTIWWCIGCIAFPCSVCIISLAAHFISCCRCAEFMGWID
jgi:rhodanese-related sulfurtransferase